MPLAMCCWLNVTVPPPTTSTSTECTSGCGSGLTGSLSLHAASGIASDSAAAVSVRRRADRYDIFTLQGRRMLHTPTHRKSRSREGSNGSRNLVSGSGLRNPSSVNHGRDSGVAGSDHDPSRLDTIPTEGRLSRSLLRNKGLQGIESDSGTRIRTDQPD